MVVRRKDFCPCCKSIEVAREPIHGLTVLCCYCYSVIQIMSKGGFLGVMELIEYEATYSYVSDRYSRILNWLKTLEVS